MLEEIADMVYTIIMTVLCMIFGLALIAIVFGFAIGLFAIPVWIVCWAFDLAFSWKVVIGVAAIFAFLAMISG